MQKVLILVGPTASGKSALAVKLAKKFNGEVISADSRQVYRGLNIGTGKIANLEMAGVPHHLLDVARPKKVFSAQDFIDHAARAINDIISRGKLPIIAGGTGFYIDALVGRINLPNVAPDPTLRARLEKKNAAQLYELLQKKDPARAKMMATPSERNNKVRLIRALEIATNYKAQSFVKKEKPERLNKAIKSLPSSELGKKYDCLWIGIAPDMKALDRKIKKRLIERFEHGMIAEAKRLHADGLSYKRMSELGLEYRSLASYLQKKISRKELETELYAAIRRYAHKQMGYWKRNKDIRWFPSPTARELMKTVSMHL
jgi:tRNA dimethylallyltransferase